MLHININFINFQYRMTKEC